LPQKYVLLQAELKDSNANIHLLLTNATSRIEELTQEKKNMEEKYDTLRKSKSNVMHDYSFPFCVALPFKDILRCSVFPLWLPSYDVFLSEYMKLVEQMKKIQNMITKSLPSS